MVLPFIGLHVQQTVFSSWFNEENHLSQRLFSHASIFMFEILPC